MKNESQSPQVTNTDTQNLQRQVHWSQAPLQNVTRNEELSGLGSMTTQLTTATANYVKAKGSVLLQTATAIATNEDPLKSVAVRILFDSGSQQSYITDNLKSKLGLKSTSTETL